MRDDTYVRDGGVFVCFCGCSDKVPGPLDGAAEHHAEDHPEDLWRGGDGNTGRWQSIQYSTDKNGSVKSPSMYKTHSLYKQTLQLVWTVKCIFLGRQTTTLRQTKADVK